MVALSRCLSSLAVLAGHAVGARIAVRRGQNKFIAGVPVLNYQAAVAGESLGELGAQEEWVVVMKQGVTDAQISKVCAHAPTGCNLVGHPDKGGVPFLELRATESDLQVVVKAGDGLIKFIEPDTLYAIPELRADETESGLWGLERVAAYSRSSEGNGVTVFILDTGVRVTHQDFGGRGIPTLDLTSGSPVECNGDLSCAADNQGHGTHCAGTAVGTQYGVAPGASLRSIKVLSDQGSGSWSWSFAALDWLTTSSIRPAIASMSLGGSGTQEAMKLVVDRAVETGVTVVVAGGNDNSDACNFSPAFVPSAITVGSTDSLHRRSSFSNYGQCTNIWAPGSSVLSAWHTSDTASSTLSGTSMACPHVAGGAALVLQRNPSFLSPKILEELHATARIDELIGLYPSDVNKELYVGEGGAPQPVPTPAPPAGTWIVQGSGCVMTGSCILSKNYPADYGNNEECSVTMWEVPIAVFGSFATELSYDKLVVGGIEYSGTPPANLADLDGTYTGTFFWSSDSSITKTGWQICRTDLPTPAPSPTPPPPTSPPPSNGQCNQLCDPSLGQDDCTMFPLICSRCPWCL